MPLQPRQQTVAIVSREITVSSFPERLLPSNRSYLISCLEGFAEMANREPKRVRNHEPCNGKAHFLNALISPKTVLALTMGNDGYSRARTGSQIEH